MFSLIKLFIKMTKEMIRMNFTTSSMIAKSYAVLILAGLYTIDEVPNVGNLREIVTQILAA